MASSNIQESKKKARRSINAELNWRINEFPKVV